MTKIFAPEEIGEVIEMLVFQDLDIRAVTLGLNLQGCASPDVSDLIECVERVVGGGPQGSPRSLTQSRASTASR